MADLSMHEGMPFDEESTPPPISTGELPRLEEVRDVVTEAYEYTVGGATGMLPPPITMPSAAEIAAYGFWDILIAAPTATTAVAPPTRCSRRSR